MNDVPRRASGWRLLLSLLLVAAVGLAVVASASAAAPQNTTAPSISGTAKEGSTLTASDGTWSNSPTSFSYQWQRCASDGSGCGDITSATSKTYTLVTGDVGHTVRVVVTAINADGKASATSAASDVVASKNGPTNTVKPAISGSAVVGETLSVSNGTWTPTPSSFSRQWQRCTADGTDCLNITGATGQTYGVRSADIGHRLRALVTAHTATDQATATSNPSAVVTQTTVTTTQTTTTVVTTPAPKPPTIAFLSLHRIGTQIYARFRVCDQRSGTIRITERDQKARALPYTRHLAVRIVSCGTFSRHWLLLPRYRSPGRYLVTLRAADATGALSRLVSRSLQIH
jgi:hypothetical protein